MSQTHGCEVLHLIYCNKGKKLDSEPDRFVYVPSNEITNAALRNAAHTPKQAFFTFKMSRDFTIHE